MKCHRIHKTSIHPEFCGAWDGPVWSSSETIRVDSFHPASSDHRPEVRARVLYDDRGIYVIFKVKDCYVRCVHTVPQSPVCRDSCVEFFFKPRLDAGYLNVEANCGGTFHCSFITDPTRTTTGFKASIPLKPSWLSKIRNYHSLPMTIEPEVTEPVEWILEYCIPVDLIEAYMGPLGTLCGQTWQANFFKCGDQTSHPHWASWASIGDELNFHQPDKFAPITFVP